MEELKKFFKFLFSKKIDEDDKRKRSIIMLTIYIIFLVVVIMAVRNNGNTTNDSNNKQKEIKPSEELKKEESEKKNSKVESDINYSYMFTVMFDAEVETYIGKRIDDKQKFSYHKNNNTIEYAIVDDNYFVLEGDTYHIIDKLNTKFKYCDIEKILSIIEDVEATKEDNLLTYKVDNSKLAYTFSDVIIEQNNNLNTIVLNIDGDNIQDVDLDFSNYISSILNGNHTLTIKMEYANIGTVDNFTIKLK